MSDLDRQIQLLDDNGTPISSVNPLPTSATITGDVNVDASSVDLSGIIGKKLGVNSDFITTYTSATQITLSGLPSFVSAINADDIESIRQIDNTGEEVATYTKSDAIINVTTNIITITGAVFAATDTFIVFTNIPRSGASLETGAGNVTTDTQRIAIATDDINLAAIKVATELLDNVVATIGTTTLNRVGIFDDADNQITSFGGSSVGSSSSIGGGSNTYSTEQEDFTAAIVDATNNILLSTDIFSENNFANSVLKIYQASTEEIKTVTLDDFTWTSATKIIDTTNCTGAFTFATGDIVSLSVSGVDKSYDKTLDITKTIEQSPLWNRYTDSESLVTAQDLTAAYADFGSTIDMRGFTHIGVAIVCDNNSSQNVTIKPIRIESTDEFDMYKDGTLVEETLWATSTVDTKQYHEFEIGSADNIKLKALAGTVGATAGDLTIDIIKIWRG